MDILKYKRNRRYGVLDKAFTLAEEFIKTKKLLLVGGMALDFALRLKGTHLYPDNKMPDYDVVTPNFQEIANEFATILCKKSFPGISNIGAMHVTTMKVRVEFEPIMDITYSPPTLYPNIPHLNYKGFIIRHPQHQYMDILHALAYPLDNCPREVIFERLKKDLERAALITQYYPFEKPEFKTRELITFKPEIISGVCHAGILAYIEILEVAAKLGISLDGIPVFTKDGDAIKIPEVGKNFIFAYTDDIWGNAINYTPRPGTDDKPPTWYHPLLDIFPMKLVINGVSYFDNYGKFLACFDVDGKPFASIQAIALQFLGTFYYHPEKDVREFAYELFYSLLELQKRADEMKKNESPFKPLCGLFGADTFNDATYNFRVQTKQRFQNFIRNKKERENPENSQKNEAPPKPEIAKTDERPKNAYPELPECLTSPKFDPATSELFQIDGSKMDPPERREFVEYIT